MGRAPGGRLPGAARHRRRGGSPWRFGLLACQACARTPTVFRSAPIRRRRSKPTIALWTDSSPGTLSPSGASARPPRSIPGWPWRMPGRRSACSWRNASRWLKRPRDAWAIHALAHALYEMAAFDTGITRLPPAIEPCTHLGWFRNHLLWHLALMHLARGEYDVASELGRTVFEHEPSSIPGDLHDSISLLWRLELLGRDVAERWTPFARIAAERLDRQALLLHAAQH